MRANIPRRRRPSAAESRLDSAPLIESGQEPVVLKNQGRSGIARMRTMKGQPKSAGKGDMIGY